MRKNHARVGNSHADDGDQFLEIMIADRMRRFDGRRSVESRFQSGNGNGMRSHAAVLLQLQGMEKQSQNFILVIIKTEKRADAHIINAAFLRAVHRGEPLGIILLGSAGMHYFVSFVMISFLK